MTPLFISFFLNYMYTFIFHTHSFIIFAESPSTFYIAVRSGRGPPLGAELRFELGAALQQPDALTRRTLEPRRTSFLIHKGIFLSKLKNLKSAFYTYLHCLAFFVVCSYKNSNEILCWLLRIYLPLSVLKSSKYIRTHF